MFAIRSKRDASVSRHSRRLAENFIRNHFQALRPPAFAKPERGQPLQGFYIADAGEGGNLFSTFRRYPRFPPSPAPHPPENADIHRPVAITGLLKSILQNLSVWITISVCWSQEFFASLSLPNLISEKAVPMAALYC